MWQERAVCDRWDRLSSHFGPLHAGAPQRFVDVSLGGSDIFHLWDVDGFCWGLTRETTSIYLALIADQIHVIAQAFEQTWVWAAAAAAATAATNFQDCLALGGNSMLPFPAALPWIVFVVFVSIQVDQLSQSHFQSREVEDDMKHKLSISSKQETSSSLSRKETWFKY